MHDILKERLWRNIEALPEEKIYQVLDYVEFLGSKYARGGVTAPVSPFRRFGERLEDRLRLNGVGFGAIRGTLEAMGAADRVVSDIAEAGRSLIRDVEDGLRTQKLSAGDADKDGVRRIRAASEPVEVPGADG